MPLDRRTELGLDPEGLRARPCPACGELKAVRTQRDDDGTKRYFCAVCGADLGEEGTESFDAPDLGFPDA